VIARDTEVANGMQVNRKQFLSKKELSEYLGISVFTVDSWVSERREIPFIKMGKRVMFDHADIVLWVEKNKVKPHDLLDRSPKA